MNKLIKQSIGFTQVANILLYDSGLSFKAKGIYSYLYSKPDGWDFSSDRIANDSKDGVDGVLSGLRELEKTGYLERKRLKTGKVSYYLKCQIGKKPNRENPCRAIYPTGETQGISNKEVKVIKKNINIDFEFFWNLYDKKVGKPKAEKKWVKLKDEERQAIINYIPEYLKACPEKQYRKNPETFFNNRAWEDEIIIRAKKENSVRDLHDGTKAKMHCGEWVDARDKNVKINLQFYPELTKV